MITFLSTHFFQVKEWLAWKISTLSPPPANTGFKSTWKTLINAMWLSMIIFRWCNTFETLKPFMLVVSTSPPCLEKYETWWWWWWCWWSRQWCYETVAFEATGSVIVEVSLEFQVQISGLRMKAEFIHIRSRSVTYLGRPPPPSFVSLNLDGPLVRFKKSKSCQKHL